MHRLTPISLLATAAALLSGCTTLVSGGRADPTQDGIEYSLPVPVIRVTPQADGTMQVAVEYLPDPDNTYMLRTSSFISSYTLDVVRENGMLKSVNLDAKSDAVAAAAVDSVGNVLKARGEAEGKAREAALADAKAQAKTLDDATTAVAVAQAKVDALVAGGATTEKILDARVDLAEKQATLDGLTKKASGQNAFNVALDDVTTRASPHAAAPVLFRVVPDTHTGGVSLIAFEGPRFLPTSVAAKAIPPKAPDLEISIVDSAVLVAGTSPLQFRISVNRRVSSIDLSRSQLTVAGTGADRHGMLLAANVNKPASPQDPSIVIVTLDSKIPKGSYFFTPVLVGAKGQPMMTDPVTVTVN